MNLIDAVVREEDGKLYIDIAKNIRLYIPENKQSVLKAYIDKPVCFGIRPEHISLSLKCKEMNTVTGALSIIENMGSENIFTLPLTTKSLLQKSTINQLLQPILVKICISTLIQASVIYLIFTLKKI